MLLGGTSTSESTDDFIEFALGYSRSTITAVIGTLLYESNML